jgi:ankyrin repeat protein
LLDVIERLLQDPTIDINLTDSSGNTALIVAARYNHEKVIRRLLNHAPVDVSAHNQKGETALVEAGPAGISSHALGIGGYSPLSTFGKV